MTEYNIPHAVRQAIDDYVKHHYPTGGFTRAVLENNLREAIGRADKFSMASIKDIVMYCHWEIPHICWGSVEKVEAWLNVDADEVAEGFEEITDSLKHIQEAQDIANEEREARGE